MHSSFSEMQRMQVNVKKKRFKQMGDLKQQLVIMLLSRLSVSLTSFSFSSNSCFLICSRIVTKELFSFFIFLKISSSSICFSIDLLRFWSSSISSCFKWPKDKLSSRAERERAYRAALVVLYFSLCSMSNSSSLSLQYFL